MDRDRRTSGSGAARRACVRAALTLASPVRTEGGKRSSPSGAATFGVKCAFSRVLGSQVRGDFCRSWQHNHPNRAVDGRAAPRTSPPTIPSAAPRTHAKPSKKKKEKKKTPRESEAAERRVCAGEPGVALAGLPGGEEHDQRRGDGAAAAMWMRSAGSGSRFAGGSRLQSARLVPAQAGWGRRSRRWRSTRVLLAGERRPDGRSYSFFAWVSPSLPLSLRLSLCVPIKLLVVLTHHSPPSPLLSAAAAASPFSSSFQMACQREFKKHE